MSRREGVLVDRMRNSPSGLVRQPRQRWLMARSVGGYVTAFIGCCASALVCMPVAGQSLADVARMEAERRKAITQPSRVYTNNDLKPAPESSRGSERLDAAPDTQPSSATRPRGERAGGEASGQPRAKAHRRVDASGDAVSEAGAEDREHSRDERERDTSDAVAAEGSRSRGDDEQRWHQRMAEARERVDRSYIVADALQSRINALTADFAARDDPAQRAVIGNELNKALAELERVRGEIGEDDKEVAELEEEARRAGVPPGWLR